MNFQQYSSCNGLLYPNSGYWTRLCSFLISLLVLSFRCLSVLLWYFICQAEKLSLVWEKDRFPNLIVLPLMYFMFYIYLLQICHHQHKFSKLLKMALVTRHQILNFVITRSLSCYGFQKVGYTAENCKW